MGSIMEAREQAHKLASKRLKLGLTNYGMYDSIYIASTSNVKGTLDLYKDYDSVLTVGATGAHAYEAALAGAKKVDQFDINELQRLFYEYMKVAIIKLSYEDFIKYFTLKRHSQVMSYYELKDLLSSELYHRIRSYLPEDVDMVFGDLFSNFSHIDLIMSSLFRFEHAISTDYLKSMISFYNEEEYYKLQDILRNNKCEISYHTTSLKDIPHKFDDKYDLILLYNILQYYKNIPGLNNPNRVHMFLDKNLNGLLTDSGVIQANYGFTVAAEAVKKYYGMPTSTDIWIANPFSQMETNKEIKEGIDVQLLRKWDNYRYDFIDAVESFDGLDTQNVIITYKPKRTK